MMYTEEQGIKVNLLSIGYDDSLNFGSGSLPVSLESKE